MQYPGRPRIVDRAKKLLWVIACCDVENVQAHRSFALERLRDLESGAAEMRIPDLYREVVQAE
jgi:hypothetical protein